MHLRVDFWGTAKWDWILVDQVILGYTIQNSQNVVWFYNLRTA